MRSLLYIVPVAAGIAFLGSARAADAPVPIYEAIPDEVVFQAMDSTWEGLFAGIHGGYSKGDFSANLLGGVAQAFDDESYVVGGQIGYDFEFNNLIIGAIIDASYTEISGFTNAFGALGQFSVDVDWLATARGRIGYALGNFLPFITGGAAFAGLDMSLAATSDTETRSGWTAGGGVEYALGNGLTLGGEYLYVDLGEERNTFGASIIETDLAVHVVRASLNYRFSY